MNHKRLLKLVVASSSSLFFYNPASQASVINMDAVMAYGLASYWGGSVLNTPGTENYQSYGSYNLGYSWYMSCPSIYYNSDTTHCDCNSGEQTDQNAYSGNLFFGAQNPSPIPSNSLYGSTSPYANWDSGYTLPDDSSITQTQSSPWTISYSQASSTSDIKENGFSYSPGDVFYELLGTYVYNGLSGQTDNNSGTILNFSNPVIFNFWNVTDTTGYTYKSGSKSSQCSSLDTSTDGNMYGGPAHDFSTSGVGNTWTYSYSIETAATSDNPTLQQASNTGTSGIPTTGTNGGQLVLGSASGSNDTWQSNYALSDPWSQANAAGTTTAGSDCCESYFNYYSDTGTGTTTNFTVGATTSQTSTQNTFQGSYSYSSSSYNSQQSFSLGDTNNLNLTYGVDTDDNTMSVDYQTAYQTALNSTDSAIFSTATTTSTTSTGSMTLSGTITGGTVALDTPSGTGSAQPSSGAVPSSYTTDADACYQIAILIMQGTGTLDAYSSLNVSSTYLTFTDELNNTKVTWAPQIGTLANSANNNQWWNSVEAPVMSSGTGASDMIVVNQNDGTVNIPNSASISTEPQTSISTSNYETDYIAPSCQGPATTTNQQANSSSLTPVLTMSNKEQHYVSHGRPNRQGFVSLNRVAMSELNQPIYSSFPSGVGIPARHGNGFSVNQGESHRSLKYVGSQSNDNIRLGFGNDILVAGAGNDLIHTGPGRDIVSGGTGHNTIHGEEGNDILLAGPDTDNLYGEIGDDILVGGGGIDHFIPGPGSDKMYLSEKARSWIDGLSPMDDIRIGSFSIDKQGKLVKKADISDQYFLKKIPQIGLAALTNKHNGASIATVKSENFFIQESARYWASLALLNILTLPKEIFIGIDNSQASLDVLGERAKAWYMQGGFVNGSKHFIALSNQELPKKFNKRLWVRKLALTIYHMPINGNNLSTSIENIGNFSDTYGFVRSGIAIGG